MLPPLLSTSAEGGLVPVARNHARTACRRSCRAARKPACAGCDHPFDDRPLFVRRHLPDAFCLGCCAAARSSCTTRSMRQFSPVKCGRNDATRSSCPDPSLSVSPRTGRSPSTDRRRSSRRGDRRNGSRTSPAWHEPDIALVDVAIFGEAALAPARRGAGGKPTPMPVGSVTAPRGDTGGIVVAELTRTEAGTLALRGPMVPQHSFPPGIEGSGLPYFKIGPRGLVDSGYTCRIDSVSKGMVVTGAPAGNRRRRRLSFSTPRPSGNRRPHRRRRNARGVARSDRRLTAYRQRCRSRHDPGGTRHCRCQSARRRGLSRPQRIKRRRCGRGPGAEPPPFATMAAP